MARPFNYVSRDFWNFLPNLKISNDLQLNTDGGAEVTKWVTDYKYACPKPITTYFSQKPWHPLYVNRYMSLQRLLTDLQNSTLSFLSPKLWKDPFERTFYDDNLTINNRHYDIRCICTTYDYVENEEAEWNRSNKKIDMVRVSFCFDKFCELLDGIGKKEKCVFYISIADYSQSKDNLIKSNTPKYASIEEYIKVMSLKRKAFSYENEMRIFAVFEEPNLPKNDVVPFNINDYKSIINNVTLPPLNSTNNTMKGKLTSLLPDSKVQESGLYSKW